MVDNRLKNSFPGNPSRDDIHDFCAAGKTGDIENLKKFLNKFGASIINERDSGGDSALTWAAWTGQLETVAFLLKQGAAIEGPGMHGKTALIWATQGGKKDVVALLLEKGASPDAKDDNGETVFTIADRNDRAEIAKLIRDWVETKKQQALLKRQEEEARAIISERLNRLKQKAPKLKIPPRAPGK